MKIVRTKLTGKDSFENHVWNDAMETAAQHCEEWAKTLRHANGPTGDWVWPSADRFTEAAAEFRQAKRREP